MLRLVPENDEGGTVSGSSLAGAMVQVELVGGGYAMIGNVGDVPISGGSTGHISRTIGLRIYTPKDKHSYRIIGDTAYVIDSTDFRRDVQLEGISAFFGLPGACPGDWTPDRQFRFYLDEEIPENSFILPPKIGRVIVPKA